MVIPIPIKDLLPWLRKINMRFCLPFIFAIITINVFAQQDAQYSQYMFNTMVINPAYAGYKGIFNASLLHRDQWSGFEGAPQTQSIVIDDAWGRDDRVGLGLAIVNDKVGIQRHSSAHVNYAYRLPVSDNDDRLALGLSLGVSQFMLNGSDATTQDAEDPNFSNRGNYFVPDARFGVYFSNNKLYAGISGTNLLADVVDYDRVGQNTIAKQAPHFFLTGGYLLDINEDTKFKPSFLVKEDTKGPTSIDINSSFLLKEKLWLGASYRTGVNLWKKSNWNNSLFRQNSLVGVVEFYFREKFRVGYAYDYSLSKLVAYTNGTHEISVGVILNSNRKSSALLTPRYF